MFDSKKTFAGQITDAIDLAIDFATLGSLGSNQSTDRFRPAWVADVARLRSTGTWNSAIDRFAAQS